MLKKKFDKLCKLVNILSSKSGFDLGALSFDDNGNAILHTKNTPKKTSPPVVQHATPSARRDPTPPRREPTPEPEEEEVTNY